MEELNKCIKSFKKNKASALDNIPFEILKTGALNMQILEACNIKRRQSKNLGYDWNNTITKKMRPREHRKLLWNIFHSGSC